ncbi:MAG: DNA topoisomerase III, partial [Parabacteroides sp.]|nr:DNA topoisomerase III [Parabacteroides sp.]
VVINVLSDQTGRTITIEQTPPEKPKAEKEVKEKKPRKPRTKKQPVCPICQKGTILRGKTAYGCSEYKNGCAFRMDYATYGEGLTDEELIKKFKEIKK